MYIITYLKNVIKKGHEVLSLCALFLFYELSGHPEAGRQPGVAVSDIQRGGRGACRVYYFPLQASRWSPKTNSQGGAVELNSMEVLNDRD